MGYCIASIVKIVNTRVKHLEYVTRVGCADLWAQIQGSTMVPYSGG